MLYNRQHDRCIAHLEQMMGEFGKENALFLAWRSKWATEACFNTSLIDCNLANKKDKIYLSKVENFSLTEDLILSGGLVCTICDIK